MVCDVTGIQVFDLLEEAPEKALGRIYLNLEKLKQCGNQAATNIMERMRVIVSLKLLK